MSQPVHIWSISLYQWPFNTIPQRRKDQGPRNEKRIYIHRDPVLAAAAAYGSSVPRLLPDALPGLYRVGRAVEITSFRGSIRRSRGGDSNDLFRAHLVLNYAAAGFKGTTERLCVCARNVAGQEGRTWFPIGTSSAR